MKKRKKITSPNLWHAGLLVLLLPKADIAIDTIKTRVSRHFQYFCVIMKSAVKKIV